MSELKSCPCCGGNAEWEFTGDYVYIQCEDCLHATFEGRDPTAVKKAWNNRPHENKIKAEAVREAFKKAEIPAGAKSGCIGEFSIYVENGGVCPNCYGGSCDEDGDAECEVCHGESDGGLLDVSYDIPWTTQKEIFKAFCKYAEIEAGRKLERGEL